MNHFTLNQEVLLFGQQVKIARLPSSTMLGKYEHDRSIKELFDTLNILMRIIKMQHSAVIAISVSIPTEITTVFLLLST